MEAKGATTMVVKGEEEHVKEALKIVKSIKGSRIPQISPPNCVDRTWPMCPWKGKRLA